MIKTPKKMVHHTVPYTEFILRIKLVRYSLCKMLRFCTRFTLQLENTTVRLLRVIKNVT
jgi:hypothetical protein